MTVARSLEFLVASEKKQVRISIQETHEYLQYSNQVSPSPLQGMKAQLLQSLFVGEVTNANYQQAGTPYSKLGRTKSTYNGIKADFERSWKERLIGSFSALSRGGECIVCLNPLNLGPGYRDGGARPIWEKDNLRGLLAQW